MGELFLKKSVKRHDFRLEWLAFALFCENFKMKTARYGSRPVTMSMCEEWAGRSLGCNGLEESPDSAGHGGG